MSKLEVNTVAPQCGTTLTLGESGDTVTLGSGASQSGFGRTGTVDWQTGDIKTATFTAANGEGYFCNTSGGAFTVNLPAGSAGAIVSVSDYTRTFQTNNLTVSPNGSEKIGGVAANATLSTEGQTATFVYVDGTEGWINTQETSNSVTGQTFITATGGTETECGDFKIHTFTGPGTFTVSCLANCSSNNEVSYMVVAGGAAGGAHTGGGGGAGGFREGRAAPDCYTASPLNAPAGLTVTAQAYPITVAAGGTATTNAKGGNGGDSIFSTITSAGGGGGGGSWPSAQDADNGGSGGGAGGESTPSPNGSGNTPPVSPPQGNDGGNTAFRFETGGGGGATTAGVTGSPTSGGNGGTGATTSISGSSTAYAGGGGGSSDNYCSGTGGTGGGTPGVGSGNATNAGNNTGGGGGATHAGPTTVGGNGGSGIVIIRYKFQ